MTNNFIFNKYLSEFINKDKESNKILTPTEIYFNKKKMIREWRQHYYRGNRRFSIIMNDDYYIYIENKNLFLLFKNYFIYFFLHGCGISSIHDVKSNKLIHINSNISYVFFYLFINKYVLINTFYFVKYVYFLCQNTQYIRKKRFSLLYKKTTLYFKKKFNCFTKKILLRSVNLFSFISNYTKTNHFINSIIFFYFLKKLKFFFKYFIFSH